MTLATLYGAQDGFITLLDTAGQLVWVKQFGCTGAFQAWDLDVDDSGNVVSTGVIYNDADMDPGPGTFMLTVPSSFYVTYVVSVDSNGLFNWAGKISCTGYTRAHGLRTDHLGNVYVSGWFSGTVDLNPSPSLAYQVAYHGNMDSYLLQLSSAGLFNWARTWGGPQGCTVNGLDISPDGAHQYIAGNFGGTLDANPGAGYFHITTQGSRDLYTLKLGPYCVPSFIQTTVDACDFYLSPDGTQTWTLPGTYQDTLINADGCDSVITIDLSISHADVSVTQNAGILNSGDSTATWQWIDCDAGLAPIPGATQQSFAPTAVGHYAVIVTNGSCTDTSACVEVSTISREEGSPSLMMLMYPNPGKGEFILQREGVTGPATVIIYNSLGMAICRMNWMQNRAELPVSFDAAPGLYEVVVEMNGGSMWTGKLLVE